MVVTRFAPSPTGQLHIGGARTALFCWAYARRSGGRFVLRIEDTDQARSSESSLHNILDALAWLGIRWDDGPAFSGHGVACGGDSRGIGPFEQSRRIELYNREIDRLIAEGKAYHAFETAEELDAKRRAVTAQKNQYRYDRAALTIDPAERLRRAAAGEPHVVRFLVPEESVTVRDRVLGDVSFAAGEVDDFVLRKADGFPTYHFAVVVDDEAMGVTHVLRGQEHLNNTPKHVALQNALGYRVPVYAHMPLIFNDKGMKMSKRERDAAAREVCRQQGISASPTPLVPGDAFAAWLADSKRQLEPEQVNAVAEAVGLHLPEVNVEDFREAGYLPEVITNYIALLGWTPSKNEDGSDREKFDMNFLANDFDLDRIGKSNARFDRTKLLAFNQDAIAAMPEAEFAARWRSWCERYSPELLDALTDERFAMLARAVRPRARSFADAIEPGRFALMPDDGYAFDEKAVAKVLHKGEPSGLAVLRAFRPVLESFSPFEPEPLEAAVKKYCEENGLGIGKLAQPLRIALTGAPVSPGIGETLALLGRASVLRRIDRCLDQCAAVPG